MNDPSDLETSRLLRQATHDLHDHTSDVDTLVRGGLARGRTRRRRRRAGTALAAVAVVGVIGAAASVGPALLDRGTPSSAPGFATTTPEPPPSDVRSETPTDPPPPTDQTSIDALVTVSAEDVPAVFGDVLGGDVGDVLRGDGFGVRDERQHKVVHFLYEGTLTSFIIERADSTAPCAEQVASAQEARGEPAGTCEVRDGVELLVWGPDAADGVTAQGVSAWVYGYVVSALSHNAADGKDAPTVTEVPPISIDELVGLATSDVWFAEPANGS